MDEKGKEVAVKPDSLPATNSLLEIVATAARDPNVNVEKMERLLDMVERISLRENEAAYNKAMNACQADLRAVVADSDNIATKSRYASYPALDRVLRPIYNKHGFSLSFDTAEAKTPESVRVLCYVSHNAGFKRTYFIDMPADGKGAKGGDVMTKTHATGSAVSYGMRYLLKMIFNVAVTEDDDGNAAGIERITEKQAADLRAMATEIGVNIPAFLKVMKVEAFEEIPAKRFKDAVATLEAKRKKGAA